MFSPSVLPKIQGVFRGSDVEINTERYRSGHNGADSKKHGASSGLWVRIRHNLRKTKYGGIIMAKAHLHIMFKLESDVDDGIVLKQQKHTAKPLEQK